ncbi:MAG: alpha-glucoside transport system permease protein [Actinomycetota bacterium]|nr:alpha-glucoside transport system permease protein [Actinomycetota bacterium]
MLKVINALLAIFSGVLGSLLLYYILNKVVERLPNKWEDRVKPYVFVGPAVLLIGFFLIYPAVRTVVFSFANSDSTAFIGLKNYTDLLGSKDFVTGALLNTLLWMIVVPAVTVVFGLAVAVLADRLQPRAEKFTKSIIFLPMAISLVGASTIWRFVYASNPKGTDQVGLLNGILVALGMDPVSWLQLSQAHANSLLLMVIMIWAQVGFSMVLLSAAVKGVPEDTIEAGRIDGASEKRIFFNIVVPQIWPTVITVFITVLIGVMKIFDVIYVMTGGNFNTDVIGMRFYTELFTNGNNGFAAAIVVMLMIAIVPVMIYQVRHFRRQEA